MGPGVIGIEADYSGGNIAGSASQSLTAQISGLPPGDSFQGSGSAEETLNSLGTVRGRLGFTPIPPLLIYATGGFAYGNGSSNTALTLTPLGTCGLCAPGSGFAAASRTLTGWTAGGGLEWMLTPHVTLKAEYLYYDLGTLNYVGPAPAATAGGTLLAGVTTLSSAAFRGSIVRVGLNYRFDLF
jgi:outer membrane immunogenic protein